MKVACRRLVVALVALTVASLTVWGSMAISYTEPVSSTWIQYTLISLFVAFGLFGIFGCLSGHTIYCLPFTFAFIVILVWWSNIAPYNDRQWQADVSVLPTAEISGDFVTLRNIRNFSYRSETDFTPRWYDRTVDLKKLDSLDLIAVYWMGDAIAHTIVSFGFAGQQIAFSIETRKELGESYSTLGGLFRRYELYYVVGDERDLIGLRTTYRNPAEDVYLYRVKARREGIRRLFLEYLHRINNLSVKPEFYNTLTTNCTTNIVTHVRAFSERLPLSWKMLASGYFPELLYETGLLVGDIPFDELRAKSLINVRARKADGDSNFSHIIREGLPGFHF